MIRPDWYRMMASYNAEINRRLLTAAGEHTGDTDRFLVLDAA